MHVFTVTILKIRNTSQIQEHTNIEISIIHQKQVKEKICQFIQNLAFVNGWRIPRLGISPGGHPPSSHNSLLEKFLPAVEFRLSGLLHYRLNSPGYFKYHRHHHSTNTA